MVSWHWWRNRKSLVRQIDLTERQRNEALSDEQVWKDRFFAQQQITIDVCMEKEDAWSEVTFLEEQNRKLWEAQHVEKDRSVRE